MTFNSSAASTLFLGIDTGGTYTDAVLWSQSGGVAAKAKSLTTRHDLAIGISGAVKAVMDRTGVDPAEIKLVSMSTTLATNALVEGQGGRVALVMIGFTEADLARDRLDKALGGDPVVFCEGGHDVHGNARPLDLAALESALDEAWQDGLGICGLRLFRHAQSITRTRRRRVDPRAHRLAGHREPRAFRQARRTAQGVDDASQCAADLDDRPPRGGDRQVPRARGITAPLMVVRGDGALVSAAFARQRPIETILSGPAAGLVGARHMTGLDDAVVSDIGGTTTDVAVLDKGRPGLDPEGATVGGFRTMVEAVAMRTFGLGGDSEVELEEGRLVPRLLLGPRRRVPLSLAGVDHSDVVTAGLSGSCAPNPGAHRRAFRHAHRCAGTTRRRIGRAGTAPLRCHRPRTRPAQCLAGVECPSHAEQACVARPCPHLRLYALRCRARTRPPVQRWNPTTALLGTQLFARKRDGHGRPIAETAEILAERVLLALTRFSAEVILGRPFPRMGWTGHRRSPMRLCSAQ